MSPTVQRVLHFTDAGDTSGYFPQLARWHDRSRYEMLLGTLLPMAPALRERMEAEGIDCFSCECGGRTAYLAGVSRLARFLREREIDILHTHLFDPSIVGLLAAVLARTPLRVMTRHHSDYHTRIGKRFHTRLDQFCTSLAHRVIAVSEHTAEVMRREEHAPRERIAVIHNGIDFDRVQLSSETAPAALRREFAPGDTALLLQVGRMHPEKGYDYLLPAMRLVRERSARPVRLLIAGTGPLREHYEALARDTGVADVVTFLGFRRDVPDLMVAADALILASVAEAFGLVLTEALYLGTPVIATRVGGIPEIVDHEQDGLLVPPASPEALADGIARLINEPGLEERLANAGREKVAHRFRFEQMIRRYEAVYEELAAARPGEVRAPNVRRHSEQ